METVWTVQYCTLMKYELCVHKAHVDSVSPHKRFFHLFCGRALQTGDGDSNTGVLGAMGGYICEIQEADEKDEMRKLER
ncbi:hypothetical protein AAHC03_025622 [Spirometra sp. Aus1]